MKDLGELYYCLGLEVWRDVGQTFVTQGKYVREVIKGLIWINENILLFQCSRM